MSSDRSDLPEVSRGQGTTERLWCAEFERLAYWHDKPTAQAAVVALAKKVDALTSENERLRNLVREHHNVGHWLDGSEAQRRVGLVQWGVACAVCAAHFDETARPT